LRRLFPILLFVSSFLEGGQNNPPAPNYPTNYELLCASGSSPVSMASNGIASTFDQSTGKWRANFCIDGNGNVSSPISSGGGINSQTANYTATANDNGKMIVMNGSFVTLTLPNPPPSATWFIDVLNINSSSLLVSPNGLQINGSINITQVGTGSLGRFFSNGTNYFAPNSLWMSSSNQRPCMEYSGSLSVTSNVACSWTNSSGSTAINNGAGILFLEGPVAGGNPKLRFALQDQGSCIMTAGACAAQNLGSTYASTPICQATVITSGGTPATPLRAPATITTVTPQTGGASDTSTVGWTCFGN